MKSATKTCLVTAVTLVAFGIGAGAVFVGSGVYNIGADDHHTKPAWGKSLNDDAIWDRVAFVRKLPEMTPETYMQIARVQ